MTDKCLYFQLPQNVSAELKALIVEIPTKGSPNQVATPDLDDDKKRWLVVGICLHSIISPVLRQYIKPVLTSLYQSLKQTHSIHNQSYPNHFTRYPPTNKELNYEAINNNRSLPWIQRKRDFKNYDYNVQNEVDLSKLFLETHMAMYSGFDESCDSSALLGLIRNVDKFPKSVKLIADKIRVDIRNSWAHCNFTEWNSTKYLSSFQQMYQLVHSIPINKADQTIIIGNLTKWETNGLLFLVGSTIGLDVAQEISKETRALAEYMLLQSSEIELGFNRVKIEILSIQDGMKTVRHQIGEIETGQKLQFDEIRDVKLTTKSLSKEQRMIENQMTQVQAEIKQTSSEFKEFKDIQGATVDKVKDVVTNQTITFDKINDITNNIEDIRSEIRELRYYLHIKPIGNIFFYPPNRIEFFVGRSSELELLEQQLLNKNTELHDLAICGLGGCGKTTLAIEFASIYQKLYPGGIFWLSADSDEALENSVLNLAFDININGENFKQTLIQTLKWISQLPERWLIVVDNMDKDEMTWNLNYLLLGTWKRNKHGHILVTSRRNPTEIEESLKITSEYCIYLATLTQEQGLEFLKKRTGNENEEETENMCTLILELGGLPLALEQAGAHIKVLKCSFEEYIERFKKKRLKLLKSVLPVSTELTKERLAVSTTWQLNIDYIHKHSEQEGLGTTAVAVMETAAFLYADEIPIEIINDGTPQIDNKDTVETLQDSLCVKQIIEILTRFSLFHRYSRDTLSVHRLVQEVIRDHIKDNDHLRFILQSATRMLHKALNSSVTPYDVICVGKHEHRSGSLVLWSKLAANAEILKQHVVMFVQNKKVDTNICLNLETCKLLQTTALHHSIHQRHGLALADQEQMLHIMTTMDLTKDICNDLTCIKVPLFDKDRSVMQTCITPTLQQQQNNTDCSERKIQSAQEALRLQGNESYKANRYYDAIQYYSEGIKACNEKSIDYRLLVNRSLVNIKIENYQNALDDANRCITLAPNYWKGYCLKAYAIASLIQNGNLPRSMESVGLASACIAAHLNEDCLLEHKMKINYPIVVYKVVESSQDLYIGITSPAERPYTTLLVKRGSYIIDEPIILPKSVQVIGIESGVEIFSKFHIPVLLPPSSCYRIKFKHENEINCHFENISFVTGGSTISVCKKGTATFYKCIFSNGKKGCDDFPRCSGGIGCVNTDPEDCKCTLESNTSHGVGFDIGMGDKMSGLVGYPGLEIVNGGKVYVDTCIFDRCGGGGALCDGDGSLLEITNCTVRNMRQSGVEARNGGTVKAFKNVIVYNRLHGITIGPKGHGIIQGNIIQGNEHEGIWSGARLTSFNLVDYELGSKSIIANNVICQNGLSGISLDCGLYEIIGNKIFENWIWGIMIKSRSSTSVQYNDIFENKCGGIRIGINYSAPIIIDGNTIRDHSGPGIYTQNADLLPSDVCNILLTENEEEATVYTMPPLVTNRNFSFNNDKGMQHPKEVVQLIRSCCFCHSLSSMLKLCAKCRKASYCSKDCQVNHWKRHKFICKLLQESYTIEIEMKDTRPACQPGGFRSFDGSLKGILQGPAPNPKSSKRFIVKVQSGKEYSSYNANKTMTLYDQSVQLDIYLSNPYLYHLVNECGILSANKISTKKIFCWAAFKDNGNILCIYTDNLPPFQTW